MFEKSKFYKDAKELYMKDLYKDILTPINVLYIEHDVLWLIYDQVKVDDIYKEIIRLYGIDGQYLPFHLWCEKPILVKYEFMWQKYDCISIWYDWQSNICESTYKKLRRF